MFLNPGRKGDQFADKRDKDFPFFFVRRNSLHASCTIEETKMSFFLQVTLVNFFTSFDGKTRQNRVLSQKIGNLYQVISLGFRSMHVRDVNQHGLVIHVLHNMHQFTVSSERR
jgi:hypothetical protein